MVIEPCRCSLKRGFPVSMVTKVDSMLEYHLGTCSNGSGVDISIISRLSHAPAGRNTLHRDCHARTNFAEPVMVKWNVSYPQINVQCLLRQT